MSSGGQILGTIGGAIAGFFIGGPAGAWKGAYYGAQIGYAIGGMLDPPTTNYSQTGARLSDLTVQTATYGAVIPRAYGTVALTGNIFWLEGDKLKETVHKTKQSSGGKGGGGAKTTTTTYSYSATFAVGICRGPIGGVRRIWIGPDLVYDAGSDDIETIIASNRTAQGFDLYLGTDDQEPNPRMQADKGAANVPAYRGLAYLVFRDLQLADYGNTLLGAQVKVEVVPSIVHAWGKVMQNAAIGVRFAALPSYGGTGAGFAYIASVDGGVVRVNVLDSDTAYHFSQTTGELVLKTTCEMQGTIGPSEFEYTQVWCCLGLKNGRMYYVKFKAGYEYSGWDNPYTVIAYGALKSATGPQFYIDADIGMPSARVDAAILAQRASLSLSSSYHILVAALSTTTDEIFIATYDGYWYRIDLDGVLVATGTHALNTTYDEAIGRGRGAYDCASFDGLTGRVLIVNHQMIYTVAEPVNGVYTITYINSGNYLEPYTFTSCWIDGDLVVVLAGTTLFMAHYGKTPGANPALSSIVQAECLASGLLAAGDLSLAALTSTVTGYCIATAGTLRAAIEPLQAAWPFDLIQSGYQIKAVVRGQSPVATVTWDDLDASTAGREARLIEVREMDTQLPKRLSIKYLDAAREYDVGEQYAERIAVNSSNVKALDLAIAMTATEAAQKAEILLYLYWMERREFTLRLPPTFGQLEPADVITVVGSDISYELRLTEMTYTAAGMIECRARINRATAYASTAVGESGSAAGQTIAIGGAMLALMLDLPCVTGDLDKPACVAAAAGYFAGWPGGVIHRSADGGQSWTALQAFSGPCVIGMATNTIASKPSDRVDAASSLSVRMFSGALSSVTRDAMLNGANHFAYGANGRWEIIAAQNCVLEADDTYTLTDLLRGRAGTEHNSGSHAVGDWLIYLGDSDLAIVNMDTALIGAERIYRGITAGEPIDSAADASFTYNAANLLPLSPVYLNGSRDATTGDWTLTWVRRTRVNGEWRDYVDAPLGEASEAYEVEIYADGTYATLKRTITGLTAATCTYTSAQQVTDFGSNQATLYVKVYQVSATVGRGTPLIAEKAGAAYSPTVLLLHFDGANGSTTFVDEYGHTITPVGNAQISTAQSKFGGSSALFDGTGDSLTLPTTSDLTLGSGDYTVEAFVYPTIGTGLRTVLSLGDYDSGTGCLWYLNALRMYLYANGQLTSTATLTLNAWSHVAWARAGSTVKAFINGVEVASWTNSTNISGTNYRAIGYDPQYSASSWQGHIEEFRLTKGLARYTANFTPPAAPFSD